MADRILVADDSTTIQKVLRIAFAQKPVQLLTASSLIEANSVLQTETPCAIIVDSCLPGTKGTKDLKHLLELKGGVPSVILVGTFESSDTSVLQLNGLREVIKKPFEPHEVVEAVERVLGRRLDAGSTPPPPPTRPGGIPEFRMPAGEPAPKNLPPLPKLDFEAPPPPGVTPKPPPLPTKEEKATGPVSPEEIASMVRDAVFDYCDRHFKALAKDVITAEVRRLMDQKARHLVDN